MGALDRAFLLADRVFGRVAEREAANLAGVRLSEEAAQLTGEKLLGQGAVTATEDAASQILPVNPRAWLGGGDEGKVYSNLDGSVTKVFTQFDHDVQKTASLYTELSQMGVKVPKVLDIGKTAEGSPAIRFQQIGDGDHLQMQMVTGQIPKKEIPMLIKQYDGMAKILQNNGVRVDWQTKNMTWYERQLYLLDPSFLKRDHALLQISVDRYHPRAFF